MIEGFFFRVLRSSSPQKSTFPKLDPMQDIPQNHFRVRGDSWENIFNCYLLLLELECLSQTISLEKGSLIEQ